MSALEKFYASLNLAPDEILHFRDKVKEWSQTIEEFPPTNETDDDLVLTNEQREEVRDAVKQLNKKMLRELDRENASNRRKLKRTRSSNNQFAGLTPDEKYVKNHTQIALYESDYSI